MGHTYFHSVEYRVLCSAVCCYLILVLVDLCSFDVVLVGEIFNDYEK
jgi:hypothetical protein